jgi:DNA-directed RNA polymerase subunit RPC12/RpoP
MLVRKKKLEKKEKKTMSNRLTEEDIRSLAAGRNHELICKDFSKEYQNIQSTLIFRCFTCGEEFSSSVHSYKNARKTGCPTCKKLTTSKTHTGKVVSEKTRALIGEKASQRAGSLINVTGENHPRFKGGYGRDKESRSQMDYVWMNGIKKIYNNSCALTGSKEKLICHHLDGWNIHPEKRYDLTNGVYIIYDLHKKFHETYGYGNNTEDQFVDFCKNKFGIDWYELKATFQNVETDGV